MTTKRIGVPQSGYNVDRNLPPVQGFQRMRPWDYHRARTALVFKTRGQLDKYHQFSFSQPYFPQVDFLHFFNTVSSSKTPWFTTYEDIIPRWWGERSPKEVERGIEWILGAPCKGIIGFSKATERVLEQFFDSKGHAADWKSIASKRHVLLPPQPLFPAKKRAKEIVQFCFVGGDFYRKGGAEMIAAFHQLYQRGIKNWKLTVVGNLSSWGDYASRTTQEDEEKTRLLISKMAGCVEHHAKLPNSSVMSLLSESHYLMFPTFQDTFGYVVLEAMANGCVPVTSKTRVFPEIIRHVENGFLVDLPTDASGDAHRTATSPEEKQRLTQRLSDLAESLIDLNLEEWQMLSEGSRAQIRTHHNPTQFEQALSKIYHQGLGV